MKSKKVTDLQHNCKEQLCCSEQQWLVENIKSFILKALKNEI